MIEINTKRRVEVIDITSSIEQAAKENAIDSGICLIYSTHTTTGLVVNEAEPGLIQDILGLIGSIVPEGVGYLHDRNDGNAHAHLQSVILGNSAVIPVENNRLVLGTWQKILFLELDGPRRRRLYVKFLRE